MRIAVVQLAYGDEESFGARVDRVCGLVAGLAGHDLVVLPELWGATGFGYRRWPGEAQPLDGPWVSAMADAARTASVTLHAGSFVERLPSPGSDGHDLANTSVVLGADGSVLATYRKVHRFGFGAGEPRLMEAGEDVVVVNLPDGDGGSVRAGLSTCYDLRFPEIYRQQLDAGAQVFLVPAAWPAARVAHWTLLGRARAVENQAVVVQCNTAGTHAGTAMGGCSQVVAATGEVLAEAPFVEVLAEASGGEALAEASGGEALAEASGGQCVLSVDVDLGATTAYREAFPVLADRRL